MASYKCSDLLTLLLYVCMLQTATLLLSDAVSSDSEVSAAVYTSSLAGVKETIDAEIALEQQGCV